MAELTPESYAAAIPACCCYQTFREHWRMLLCWGLVRATEEGRAMDCSRCNLATRPVTFRRPLPQTSLQPEKNHES